jgi:peroxin-19
MKDLMGELDSNPEMQKEFERMMAELVQAGQAPTEAEAIEHIGRATEAVHISPDNVAAAAGASSSSSSSSKKAGSAQQESFQDTVRRTMERMQASGASADAAAASEVPSTDEDMMAQLMRDLQAGGGGGEEDFNKMLMGMMSQLTNKDILYEPMKELYDKFPAWLEENRCKTGKEDLDRYEEQHAMVKQIVERFERKGYSDENEDDREYIVERMQRVSNAMLIVYRPSLTGQSTDASRRLSTTRSSRRHERCARSSGRTRGRLSHAVMKTFKEEMLADKSEWRNRMKSLFTFWSP